MDASLDSSLEDLEAEDLNPSIENQLDEEMEEIMANMPMEPVIQAEAEAQAQAEAEAAAVLRRYQDDGGPAGLPLRGRSQAGAHPGARSQEVGNPRRSDRGHEL